MAPPESHTYSCDREHPCAVCLLIPRGEHIPGRRAESRGRRKVARVDGRLLLCRSSRGSQGTALLLWGPFTASRVPAAHGEFCSCGTTELSFALLGKETLCEILRGCKALPLVLQEAGARGCIQWLCPEAGAHNRVLEEEMEHHPLCGSVYGTCRATEELPPSWNMLQGFTKGKNLGINKSPYGMGSCWGILNGLGWKEP